MIGSALARLVDFCNRGILVGHFIAIDLEFLDKERAKVPGLAIADPALDTAALNE